MQKLEQLILPFALLSVLAIRAGAIECYNCDSSINAECDDIKKNSPLTPVNCKPSVMDGKDVGGWLREITKIDFFPASGEVSVPMVCQKIVAINEKNEKVTFRGCQLDGGKTNVCDTVRNKATQHSTKIEVCETCKEDACNKSQTHIINIWLLFIPLALLKAFV